MGLPWRLVFACAVSLYVVTGKEIRKDAEFNEVVKKDGTDVIRDPVKMRQAVETMRMRDVQTPDLSERNLVEVAIDYLRPHKELVRKNLLDMPSHSSEKYTGLVNDFLEQLSKPDTSAGCLACRTGVRALQALVSNYTYWSEIEPAFLDFCMVLLGALGPTLDEMCDGIMETQGLHLFHVLKHEDVTPVRFCESMGACEQDIPRSSPPLRSLPGQSSYPGRVGVDVPKPRPRTRQNYNNTIRVAHLTDIHINTLYAEGSPSDCGLPVCCKDSNIHTSSQNTTAGPHGDYSCNLPLSTYRTMLDKVVEIDPHFVLYTGDSPPHTIWDETFESQLNCTKITATEISNKLSHKRVFATVGNHDFYPTNLFGHVDFEYGPNMTNISTMMSSQTAAMWASLSNFTQVQLDTMAAGGYYDIDSPIPKLRILAYNTDTDFYSANYYSTLNQDAPVNVDMKAHAESVLQAAQAAGDKVIVLFHHPVGSAMLRATKWWHNLVVQYSDTIVLQMAGHTHNDHFRVFRDPADGDTAVGLMFITPSMTPYGHINPSMRVFHLDENTLELVDFDSYYFNLLDSNPQVEINYQAKEEYLLDNMSPAAWLDLIERFRTDDPLYQTYYNHRNTDSYEVPRHCGESCKLRELCSMANVNSDDTAACREEYTPIPPTTESPSTNAPPSTLSTTANAPSSTLSTAATAPSSTILTTTTAPPSTTPIVSASTAVNANVVSMCLAVFLCVKYSF